MSGGLSVFRLVLGCGRLVLKERALLPHTRHRDEHTGADYNHSSACSTCSRPYFSAERILLSGRISHSGSLPRNSPLSTLSVPYCPAYCPPRPLRAP
eukprot:8445387-Pyramimonas_sp.AAC.1